MYFKSPTEEFWSFDGKQWDLVTYYDLFPSKTRQLPMLSTFYLGRLEELGIHFRMEGEKHCVIFNPLYEEYEEVEARVDPKVISSYHLADTTYKGIAPSKKMLEAANHYYDQNALYKLSAPQFSKDERLFSKIFEHYSLDGVCCCWLQDTKKYSFSAKGVLSHKYFVYSYDGKTGQFLYHLIIRLDFLKHITDDIIELKVPSSWLKMLIGEGAQNVKALANMLQVSRIQFIPIAED